MQFLCLGAVAAVRRFFMAGVWYAIMETLSPGAVWQQVSTTLRSISGTQRFGTWADKYHGNFADDPLQPGPIAGSRGDRLFLSRRGSRPRLAAKWPREPVFLITRGRVTTVCHCLEQAVPGRPPCREHCLCQAVAHGGENCGLGLALYVTGMAGVLVVALIRPTAYTYLGAALMLMLPCLWADDGPLLP